MKRLLGLLLMPFLLSSCSATDGMGTYNGYELPPYTVLMKEDKAEIRQYAPQLVAQVKIEAERGDAISKGFSILFDYIFGENESAAKVAMTTPVTQAPASEKIAMTTPVTQLKSGESWLVRFGMPKHYTKETLPKPKDKRIHFATTPASKRAVVMFSGFTGDDTIAMQTARLEAFIAGQKLKRIGEPAIAFYDSPFTFPWNRRNEISAEVK